MVRRVQDNPFPPTRRPEYLVLVFSYDLLLSGSWFRLGFRDYIFNASALFLLLCL